MSGAGSQPAGTSPYGIGTPAQAPDPTGVVLRDPVTGQAQGGRYINPATGDYQLDATGRLLGMSNVQQAFQLAMTTDVNSSAVRDMGNQLRTLDRITANFRARVLAVVTAAAKPLVDQGLVQILGVYEFKAGPADGLIAGRTYARIKFRDLTTGKEHQQVI